MSVFLNNVDDYLGPSQACVNPLFTAPSSNKSSTNKETQDFPAANHDSAINTLADSDTVNDGGIVPKRRIRRRAAPRIQTEEDASQRKEPVRLLHSTDDGYVASEPSTVEIDASSRKKKVKATVTLSDCLSCSGCVTSAEAVLMSHHSVDKFREVASSNEGNQIVFTISSAALADLYRHVYLVNAHNDSSDEHMISDGDDIKSSIPQRVEFLQQIANFLLSEFGVTLVVDGAVTQRISLLESAHEFCYRYRQKQLSQQKDLPPFDSGCDVTSVSLSSTQTRYIKKKAGCTMSDDDDTMEVNVLDHPPGLLLESDDDNLTSIKSYERNQAADLPMLASSCPGFVCLVEKTAAPVVPLLSSAKSTMAVAGILLKCGMMDTSKSDQRYFHVAVMPCHDKKLEAGRNDFAWERQTLMKYASATINENSTSNYTVNEVDLVLTTGELLEILTSAAESAGSNVLQLLDSHKIGSDQQCTLMVADTHNSAFEQSSNELEVGVHGSGSYADFIFRFAAMELFGCELPHNKPIPWTNPSNIVNSTTDLSSGVIRRRRRRQDTTDLRSIALYQHKDGSYSCEACESSKPVLNFATAYGFKNVQLILQSLSKDGYTAGALDAKCYDYVEVMACPSGCPNGGGQIGSSGQRETPRETKERVKRTTSLMPVIFPGDGDGTLASSLYGSSNDSMDNDGNCCEGGFTFKDGCFGKSARRLLHTRFHVVPKLELSTGATAGVAISDTKW